MVPPTRHVHRSGANAILISGVKRYLLRVCIIGSAANLSCGLLSAVLEFDHLEPEPAYLSEHPNYRKVLISKLGVTPFDCGRLLALPFPGGEASQSVYSKSSNGRRVYYVTRISSEKNLWDLTDGGRHPEMARSVKTQRIDAEIPQNTAELLRQVWLGMLEGSQKPRPTPPPNHAILVDASFFEFSIQRTDRPPLVGVLNISAGYAGKERTTAPALPRADRNVPGYGDRLRLLVEVSEAVYQYCVAEPAERSAIAKKIDHKVTRLLEMLNPRD